MTQEQFTTIRLTADQNKFITQAAEDIDINERIIGTVVNLGINDSPDNWIEITTEEAAMIEYEKRKAEEIPYSNEEYNEIIEEINDDDYEDIKTIKND